MFSFFFLVSCLMLVSSELWAMGIRRTAQRAHHVYVFISLVLFSSRSTWTQFNQEKLMKNSKWLVCIAAIYDFCLYFRCFLDAVRFLNKNSFWVFCFFSIIEKRCAVRVFTLSLIHVRCRQFQASFTLNLEIVFVFFGFFAQFFALFGLAGTNKAILLISKIDEGTYRISECVWVCFCVNYEVKCGMKWYGYWVHVEIKLCENPMTRISKQKHKQLKNGWCEESLASKNHIYYTYIH